MRLDKLTTKSQEALQAAQELAHQQSQQQVDGLHLALALARQQEGIIPALLHLSLNHPAGIAPNPINKAPIVHNRISSS